MSKTTEICSICKKPVATKRPPYANDTQVTHIDCQMDRALPVSEVITQLREAAHKSMDAYLDAGGVADFIIISRKDHDRNWRAAIHQLLTEIMQRKREYEVTDLEMLDHWDETPLVAVPVSVIEKYIKANSKEDA